MHAAKLAGDEALANDVEAIRPRVWAVAARDGLSTAIPVPLVEQLRIAYRRNTVRNDGHL